MDQTSRNSLKWCDYGWFCKSFFYFSVILKISRICSCIHNRSTECADFYKTKWLDEISAQSKMVPVWLLSFQDFRAIKTFILLFWRFFKYARWNGFFLLFHFPTILWTIFWEFPSKLILLIFLHGKFTSPCYKLALP